MKIANNLGQDIQNIKLSFAKCLDEDGISSGPVTLANGESGKYVATCTNPFSGSKISTSLHFNYTTAGNLNIESVNGSLIQRVESSTIPSFSDIFLKYRHFLVLIVIISIIFVLSILLHKENLKFKKIKKMT